MTNEWLRRSHGWAKVATALAVILALNACGLEEVEIPDFDGPSEQGLSITLTASPDIVTADGFSTSLVQATVRNENGELVAGRQVFMAIADASGFTADIGQLRATTPSGGIGTGLVLTTGSNGIAQAAYEAPPRTDFTANSSVLVTVRPVGTDFSGQFYRTVRIELRSAEPRLFPQVPGNAISCFFVVEPSAGPYRVNQVISFQSLGSSPNGPIVRYEWFFGDGTSDMHPQEAKVYKFPGTYTVRHVVTDNIGAQAACTASIPVIP